MDFNAKLATKSETRVLTATVIASEYVEHQTITFFKILVFGANNTQIAENGLFCRLGKIAGGLSWMGMGFVDHHHGGRYCIRGKVELPKPVVAAHIDWPCRIQRKYIRFALGIAPVRDRELERANSSTSGLLIPTWDC